MTGSSPILGDSAAIAAVRDQVARLVDRARASATRLPPLLILGETGAGKGLLAEALHRAGPRAHRPFVDLNCAAIPDTLLEAELFGYERGAFTDARQAKAGLFQAAHGGTLFLDEIGLMPASLQAKLLKAIEERAVRRLGSTRREPVDAWVLAATSEELPALVQARRFRADLYHRLAVITLRLPPLRARGADILSLAGHFLERACRDYGVPPKALTEDARAALLAYPWPGNVRELANLMERVALLSDPGTVSAATLDLRAPPVPRGRPGTDARPALAEGEQADERERLERALDAAGGNLSRAAAGLGMARNTLRYRLERLGLRVGGPAAVPPSAPAPSAPAGDRAPAAGPPAVRRVTLLRAGFALRSEADSAAEAGRVVESVLEKMRSFGGEVADLDPRGATAAFGLLPIEDAPRRAAHAALVIRQTLTRRRAGAGLRMALHTESLPVRAGAGGAGIDPDAARGVRAVLDDLLARAGAGEIALSPGAAAFLRGRFAITGPPAGTVHRLTGHAEPERELTGFVGRDRELRLLLERLDQAADGQGQAVTVVGEPGIGKSRLLRELRRALGRRAAWVEGRVASGGRATPLAALVDLLHRTLRIDDTDPEPVVIAKLERHALALGEGVAPLLPFLRYLLSVDPGDPAVAGMDPSVRRMAIFDAMRRLVFRAAEHEPQVVVIEDVHWIDQATEEWLRLVADGMVAQRVLLVSTTRPGYTPPFRERTFHTQIALAALSPADSVRMARTLMAAPELAAGLEQLIVAKTEGNPFFVEEVVRSLHEVGAVRREGDRLVLAAEAETLGLPDTVQDVILSRIERLEPELQAILELAAVIGTDVPYDVLAAVADRPDEALRAGLRALQAAEFLYETSLYPEWAHTFRHALTHDVAYGRLPPDRRRALHGRILAAIEQAHGTRLGDQAERLAYHACGAEAWAKAAAYCRQAGDRALERSAHGQAVAWFGETLAALARLPATPESVAAGIDVRFGLRSALIPLGNVARILRVLGEAETLAAAAGDRRRLGWTSAFMTIYHLLDGRHDRAREAGERAVRLADETADPGLAVVSRAYLGHVMRELGQHSMALALFEAVFRALPGDRALERFGQALQPAVYALSLGALSRAAVGGLTEAARMVDEARRISEVTARPFGLVLTGLVRAQLLTVRGAPGEAVLAAEQALGTIETHGLVLWRPWAHAVLGWAHALAGRCADGARHLELAIQDAEALPFRFGQSLWVIWLGLTHVLAGAFEPAAREAARALLLTRQRGECGYEAWAHYLAGEVASRRNPPDPAAAEAAYQAALAGAEPLAMRPLVAHSHAALERVLSLMCSTERAAAHRDQARAAYQALGLSAWPAPGGAALGAEGAP